MNMVSELAWVPSSRCLTEQCNDAISHISYFHISERTRAAATTTPVPLGRDASYPEALRGSRQVFKDRSKSSPVSLSIDVGRMSAMETQSAAADFTLLDLLSVSDIGELFFLSYLQAGIWARLACTCKTGRQLVEGSRFHLVLADCPGLSLSALRSLVLRANTLGATHDVLDISNCPQLKERWSEVKDILATMGRLRNLCIEGGPLIIIEEKHAAALFEDLRALADNVSFDVKGNEIGESGAKALAAALPDANYKMHALDLSDGDIGVSGAEALAAALCDAECNLRVLDLACLGIEDVGVEAVATAIRHLNCKVHTLKLCIWAVHSDEVHSDIGEDEDADEEEGPCGAVVKALSDVNCKLRTLSLIVYEGSVNDEGRADDFGVKLALALRSANCGLRSLHISGIELGDRTPQWMANTLIHSNYCKLRTLSLNGNNISDSGIEYLATALQHANCELRTLCLTSGGAVHDGYKSLARALRNSNCKLHTLHYGGRYAGDAGCYRTMYALSTAIGDAQCNLHTLHLHLCPDELDPDGHDPVTAVKKLIDTSRFDIEIKTGSLACLRITRSHG
ncbi:hypothetical protein CYMTET_48164 [Cymbomonas tetramitiformis]|uniref:Uncharacterized protein n=1 Tax=Cymbomonas tetramitiformis TaxID=36881 RepID=A0AAE0BSW4_9CHLO|nr:hypothetical protein CYMTET_48164 [Cymbomonas tetramitiformis]